MNYCPQCGHEGTVLVANKTESKCTNCDAQFWNNPKAAVAIIFVKDNELLFSKRAIEPNKGKYDFPGGFVEYGEHPVAACIREIKEETGVILTEDSLQLFEVYAAEYIPGVSVVDLIYVVRKWNGEFVAHDDSAALEWKPLSFIKTDSFVPHYTGMDAKLASFISSGL